MDLLRELFEINKATALLEAKKRKKEKRETGVPALGMVPVTSFVGNMVMSGDGEAMSEGKKSAKIVVDVPKPRGKHVNDVLRSKKGGRHHDHKSDFNRAKQKRERGVEEFI